MVIKNKVIFQTHKLDGPESLTLEPDSVLFHGPDVVDDRSKTSINIINKNISKRYEVGYDFVNMKIRFDANEMDADVATDFLTDCLSEGKIILDATSLGFSELFLIIKSITDLNINHFLIIYLEPSEYTKSAPGGDSFALSELNAGYRAIPRATIDLSQKDVVEAGVFFLGYEPNRIERAFEDYQMLRKKDIKVVFGVPAFQPGWELNSIVPHLDSIQNCVISYCSANDPSSAYDKLKETLDSLEPEKKMFVAPIGTKPCGIASAIFASIYPDQVGLLFDHRKKKNKRSKGIGVWHSYSINIMS